MTRKKQNLIIIELYRRIIAEYVGVMGPIVTLSTENLENKIRYVVKFKSQIVFEVAFMFFSTVKSWGSQTSPFAKGCSILFNHFINMRTTDSLSISCRKNVFFVEISLPKLRKQANFS